MQHEQSSLEYQREVLKYITEIGSSLRLHMDADTLLQRVSAAVCKALNFRCSVLYLADGMGYFQACATFGVSAEEEHHFSRHPLPDALVVQLINEEYRLGASYFVPADASIWQNIDMASFFVVDSGDPFPPLSQRAASPQSYWDPGDLLIVPLVSADNMLLGFLTPDAPLDGLRPVAETLTFLELFANQAAVAIEGVRLYNEVRQSSEERKALIEIGRALSAPDSLRDLQTVYRAIYEQVGRVMQVDVFYVARYQRSDYQLRIVFLAADGAIRTDRAFPALPTRLRQLIQQDALGRLFSTASEYAEYTQYAAEEAGQSPVSESHERLSQSFLLAPIRYAGELIGMLSAQSHRSHAYTQRHHDVLREIGVQAGIAITNARLNAEVRAALEQAQESERLKNHFLITASHELRTPLASIQGYLELLTKFNAVLDDDAKFRFINKAQRACEELVLLLGNVMDTSRIDQDHVSLTMRPVQVVKAARMILDILEPTIDREGRTVDVSIPADLYIWADDLRLRQILLNIVSNALKYTPVSTPLHIRAERIHLDELSKIVRAIPPRPASSEAAQLRLLHRAHREFALIAIRDWGPGIAPAEQESLFTKFMRLDNALNSQQQGSGLGLYLCRQLTEAMDGSIWVESTGAPGKGATFFLAFALHQN